MNAGKEASAEREIHLKKKPTKIMPENAICPSCHVFYSLVHGGRPPLSFSVLQSRFYQRSCGQSSQWRLLDPGCTYSLFTGNSA